MKVVLAPEAYEGLLIHMLSYGNKSLKKSQEVMGLLYGIRTGETVEIKKTVPVKHGPDCEKPFSETDFVTFSEIDQEMVEEGLEPFGYYTTHPKMGFYLSQNEIKNLLYFINEQKNPYAIALIGDHQKLEEKDNYGFEAFRLTDPSKGVNTDFETIPLEIQLPQGLQLFRVVKFLIEQAQKKQPYVEERGTQLTADDSIWDDAFSFGEDESEEEKKLKKIAPIKEALADYIENIEESFVQSSLLAYHEFLEKISDFAAKTFNDPNTDIVNLKNAFDDGMTNVQKWFEEIFKKHAEKIFSEYKRTHEMVDESHEEIKKTLKILLSKLIELQKS